MLFIGLRGLVSFRKMGFLINIVASVYRVGPVTTRGKAAIDSNRSYTIHRLQTKD